MRNLFTCPTVNAYYFYSFIVVGRVDPTIDDLEMVFNDSGIILKDLREYTKVVEPIALSQQVSEFPAPDQAKNELFIPEIDEDGKVISNTGLSAGASTSGLTNGLQGRFIHKYNNSQ